jgi:hypothetical protein
VYDLFLYLDGRDELQGPSSAGRYRFSPEMELKRLFLLGGIAGYAERDGIFAVIEARLPDWAEASELRRGESLLSEDRVLRVDVAGDEPPQWGSQGASQAYSGWLLDPPGSFRDYLESLEPGVSAEAEGA